MNFADILISAMSFRAFRNIFRNILKLDISRVAQSEGKIAGETVNAPTSQLVRSGPRRPSTRQAVQTCSRFFTSCRGNDLIGRIVSKYENFFRACAFTCFRFTQNAPPQMTSQKEPKTSI